MREQPGNTFMTVCNIVQAGTCCVTRGLSSELRDKLQGWSGREVGGASGGRWEGRQEGGDIFFFLKECTELAWRPFTFHGSSTTYLSVCLHFGCSHPDLVASQMRLEFSSSPFACDIPFAQRYTSSEIL